MEWFRDCILCTTLTNFLIFLQCPDDLDYNVEFLMDFHLTIEGESSFAVLGDLRSCRVVVLNDDTFPNKVKDMGDAQKVRQMCQLCSDQIS